MRLDQAFLCVHLELPFVLSVFPLDRSHGGVDIIKRSPSGRVYNIKYAPGPDGRKDGSTEFLGRRNSYIEIPNTGKLDARRSMTILAWVYHEGKSGPIFNYDIGGFGVHLWMTRPRVLFIRFVRRNKKYTHSVSSDRRPINYRAWNYIGATYDYKTGVASLWLNSKRIASRRIGRFDLATNYPIRIGVRRGDRRYFRGRLFCIQVYSAALTEKQIRQAAKRCFKGK